MESNSNFTIDSAIVFGMEQIGTLSDSAKLDCQILLAHILEKPNSYIYTWPEQLLTKAQKSEYLSLLSRRVSGEPIAYIVGTKEFWSLTLNVSPATLIPRPDTEVLIEQVLDNHHCSSLSCLDLGTGTGAIALALASEHSHWAIDAVDYSGDAVALAQRNASQLMLSQVNVFQSDWFDNIPKDNCYDLIVSNPPYIDPIDEHLSQGDVQFEPKSALISDQDGLHDIIQIIRGAKNYLHKNGWLYLEHGYQQAHAVRQIFKEYGYSDIRTVKDYNGNDRVSYACYNNATE